MAKVVALRELPEVRILEDITRDTAERVIEQLAAYKGRPVALSIFSIGGDVLAANVIAKYIANPANGLEVEARVYGNAFSGAMIIAASCKAAYVADGSTAMIHMAFAMDQEGNKVQDDQLPKDERDALAAINADQVNLFTKRTGKSREDMVKLMDEDRVITARKAADMGLFDGIIPQALQLAAYKNLNMADAQPKRKLIIGHKALLAAALTSDGHIEVDEKEFTISDAEKVKELETKKAAIEAQLTELKAKADQVPTLEAAKTDAETKLVAMTTDRDVFKAKAEALEKNPLVAAVLSGGSEVVTPGVVTTPTEPKTKGEERTERTMSAWEESKKRVLQPA